MAEAGIKCSDSDFSEEDQLPLDSDFTKAANHVVKITNKLDTNQLLKVYGLYKQATIGKCNTTRPGWLNMQGRQKWDAWNALGNMPQEEAMKKYIDLVCKYDTEWTELGTKEPKEYWVSVSTHQFDPDPELKEDEMSIFEAAKENCAARLQYLLTSKPELINECDEDGLTVLHWAADRNATEALEVALKCGVPVNTQDDSQQTALHYASQCGNTESVRLLLKSGASIEVKDEDGSTPIDVACNEDIRQILTGQAKTAS